MYIYVIGGPGPHPTAMATLARTAGLAPSGCTCLALRFRFRTKREQRGRVWRLVSGSQCLDCLACAILASQRDGDSPDSNGERERERERGRKSVRERKGEREGECERARDREKARAVSPDSDGDFGTHGRLGAERLHLHRQCFQHLLPCSRFRVWGFELRLEAWGVTIEG